MQKSFCYHGRHKFFIHEDSVKSGNISVTYINSRGLIHGYTIFVKKEKEVVYEVRRKDTFDDIEKAKKALFMRKLKGE